MKLNKKLYYTFLVLILLCAGFNCIKTQSVDKNIAMMYIHIAEGLRNAKMYDASNFYYIVSETVCKKTQWIEFNIAKNIITKYWDMPLTSSKKRQLEFAIKLLDKENLKHPNNIHIFDQYAYAYEQLEDYDNAIKYYQKVVELDSQWEYGWHKLSFIYLDYKKDAKQALYYIDKALNIKSDCDERYYLKGRILSNLKRNKEAIEYYKKYLEIYPDSVAALVNISNCALNIDDYKTAKIYTERGLKLNPHSSYLLDNKIGVLCYEHKFKEAIAECNKLLKSNEENYGWIAYWDLARIKQYQKDSKEAEKYYKKAKDNAQQYYDRYCKRSYDLKDIDGNCSNRYKFIQDFEKNKKEPIKY